MPVSLDFVTLRRAYAERRGDARLRSSREVIARIERRGDDAVWISRVPDELLLDEAAALERRAAAAGIADLPLYGMPFAVKDNIDVAGLPTTAACPEFAYVPGGVGAGRRAAAPRRRARRRQDQSRPVRHRPGRRALALWRAAQPVRPGLHPRRIELGLGGGGGGRAGELRARHRHGRLRPGAGRVQQHRRAEADPRPASARAASSRPAVRSIASRSSR